MPTTVAPEVVFRHAEPVMGTVVSFDIRPRGMAPDQVHAALGQACAVLHRADQVFSLYQPDSPMSRIRRGELTSDDAPQEVAEVLELCRQARRRSAGRFDPWAMPGGVDPTGLVKGWAAARAADVLKAHGVDAGLVNAAGDIAVFGTPTQATGWRVGIRSPRSPEHLLCAVEVTGAVATSGAYERGEAHLIDPRDGRPARGALAATVCGPDLSFADAFATALLCDGAAGLARVARNGYSAMIVTSEREMLATRGFPFVRP